MTYDNEQGAPDRLAAHDEYGTPPDGYVRRQFDLSESPDGPPQQSAAQQLAAQELAAQELAAQQLAAQQPAAEPDWRDVSAPEASGDPAVDPVGEPDPYQFWPDGTPDEPKDWPSAGAPSAGAPSVGIPTADGRLDFLPPPRVGRARPGGLHAPLAAGETDFVDWIKGLGTADAAQEQWVTADPALPDEDEPAFGSGVSGSGVSGSGDFESRDFESRDFGSADSGSRDFGSRDFGSADEPAAATLTGSADGWPSADAPAAGWESEPEPPPAPGPRRAAPDEENWFEPKPRSDGDTGQLALGYLPQRDALPARALPALPSAADASPSGAASDWPEPIQRPERPDWPHPGSPVDPAGPAGGPPSPTWEAGWPRSAAELDYVTPDQSDPDYPAGYSTPSYLGAGGTPDDDATGAFGNDETTTFVRPGRTGIVERRRKPKSYRTYVIVAVVFVVVLMGGIGFALRDSPAQSATPPAPQSTVDQAPVLPDDDSPPPTPSSDGSTPASPSVPPSGVTSPPAVPPVIRNSATPTPTPTHSSVPAHTPKPPTKSPKPPTQKPPTPTPTPSDPPSPSPSSTATP